MSADTKKTAVVFGAGHIGRGFIGKILSESGYKIIFLEILPELIDELNRRDSYHVEITGEEQPRFETVTDFMAMDSRTPEAVDALAECDLAATCVGVRNLPAVAQVIANGAIARMERNNGPLDVILAENQVGAEPIVRAEVNKNLTDEQIAWAEHNLGLVGASIGRMVPDPPEEKRKADPLVIVTEGYSHLPVDSLAFRNEIPDLKGIIPFTPFHFYEERKLYMDNMAHATCAYHGARKGYEYVWQAAGDPQIRQKARECLNLTASALASHYNADEQELREHGEDILNRYLNKEMGDTVQRVGADPVRKLRNEDRLVGAARRVVTEGLDPAPIVESILAALQYVPQGDANAQKLQQRLEDDGIAVVVTEYMGLDPESGLGERIVQAWKAR